MMNGVILILRYLISLSMIEMFLPPSLVYIFLAYSFARVCSNVSDFNNRNQFLTAKSQNNLDKQICQNYSEPTI